LEGALVEGRHFWIFIGILAFLLVEGITTRVCYMISWLNVSEFLQNFLIEWL
jgi:hypothetical protein